MKRILLTTYSLFCFAGLSFAQFSIADTVRSWTNGAAQFNDYITTTGNVYVYWKVVATNFPSDWLPGLSICDNYTCITNGSSQLLWNGTTGNMQKSAQYSGTGDFHMMNTFASVSTGTYWLTVRLTDSSGTIRNTTFVISHPTTGIGTISKTDEINIYPNPALNEINVQFGESLDIKNISVCNIIGQVLNVYKVSGNSARLSLENMPAGVYFVRLINSQGNVVATRKFNKQ
jgi:hypothetical protein